MSKLLCHTPKGCAAPCCAALIPWEDESYERLIQDRPHVLQEFNSKRVRMLGRKICYLIVPNTTLFIPLKGVVNDEALDKFERRLDKYQINRMKKIPCVFLSPKHRC